jgi:hypothetical protein
MIPSTALQDAIALLTVAMNTSADDDLRALIDEFREKDEGSDLMLALVSLCRSLCITSASLVHVLDGHVSDAAAEQLTDDDVVPTGMLIIRSFASAAARASESRLSDDASS